LPKVARSLQTILGRKWVIQMKNKRANRKRSSQRSRNVERRLGELERNLLSEVAERLKSLHNVSASDPSELLDIAADGELDYMAAVAAESGSATLAQIERALQRLKEGAYGICEACGKRISRRRLEIQPFATLCVECKAKAERFGEALPRQSVPARGEHDLTVSLTGDDMEPPEDSLEGSLRELDDLELTELF